MVKITAKLIKAKNVRQNLEKKCMDVLLLTAKELVKNTAPYVPVDTGMARSSWSKLGRFVGYTVPISPKRRLPNKNPELGEQQSDFNFSTNNGVVHFDWQTDIRHYIINEEKVPWHSLERGYADAIETLKNSLPAAILEALETSIHTVRRSY